MKDWGELLELEMLQSFLSSDGRIENIQKKFSENDLVDLSGLHVSVSTSRYFKNMFIDRGIVGFGQMAGDLRMEGDIRFIAASSFWQSCVVVRGSASMFGNIHFESCHNKDQCPALLGSPKKIWKVSFTDKCQSVIYCSGHHQYKKQGII